MDDSGSLLPEWLDAMPEGEALREQLMAALSESKVVEDLLSAQRDSFYGPAKSCAPGPLVFFHGTSWESAEAIQRDGFVPSEAGCLSTSSTSSTSSSIFMRISFHP